MQSDNSQDPVRNEEEERKGRESNTATKKKVKRDPNWEKFEMSYWQETRPQT
jgi:hypothetical protein